MNYNNNYPTYKIIVIGDSGVGKTSIIERYVKNKFHNGYSSTIGLDFHIKIITLKNGEKIRFQIWDTAGQERFKSISPSLYRGAHGIILVFDITDRLTFIHLNRWFDEIKRNVYDRGFDNNNDPIFALIANKIDYVKNNEADDNCFFEKKEDIIKLEEVKKYALQRNITTWYETSAKIKKNVDIVFEDVAEKIHKKCQNKQNVYGTFLENSVIKNDKITEKAKYNTFFCCKM